MEKYLIYYIDEMGEPIVMPYKSLNMAFVQVLRFSGGKELKDNDTAEIYHTSSDLGAVLNNGRISLFSPHGNLYVQQV